VPRCSPGSPPPRADGEWAFCISPLPEGNGCCRCRRDRSLDADTRRRPIGGRPGDAGARREAPACVRSRRLRAGSSIAAADGWRARGSTVPGSAAWSTRASSSHTAATAGATGWLTRSAVWRPPWRLGGARRAEVFSRGNRPNRRADTRQAEKTPRLPGSLQRRTNPCGAHFQVQALRPRPFQSSCDCPVG